jgi:hypothetical protein
MRGALDRFLPSQFRSTAIPTCPHYLGKHSHEFPRSFICRDGRIYRVSSFSLAQLRISRDLTSRSASPQSICIPSSIDALPNSCFKRCLNLTRVTFESGSRLSIFSRSAFKQCSSLQSICVPSSIQAISRNCFRYCTHLSIVTFEPGCRISILGQTAFNHCSLQWICIPSSTKTICCGCFGYCRELSHWTFDSGCKLATVGCRAFYGCSSLTSICLPSSLEAMCPRSFTECKSLVSVTLDNGRKLFDRSLLDDRSKSHDPHISGYGHWSRRKFWSVVIVLCSVVLFVCWLILN